MADDREILREIWDGRLPVCFNLAEQELNTIQQPEPFYLMVPRLSYFPLVTDKVRKHFARHVSPEHQDGELWLEYSGQPLKWHYPIGVLFDLYAYDTALPWSLTVHFQKFPENELLHCPSKEAVEAYFMATIKEADALKHRGQIINNMQKRDHNQLWLGLQNDKFDQFWTINRKLMEHSNDELFKFIPFRIHQPDKPFIQRLFRPTGDSDEIMTLKNLIFDDISIDLDQQLNARIIIQGIQPPLSTPVQWLSEHFSHPDNFLHICII